MDSMITASSSNMMQTSSMPQNLDAQQQLLFHLADTYNRELVRIIGWAKQIPGFSNFTLSDQMRLLQSTWIEILTFCVAWKNIPFRGKLYFTQNFYLDEKIAQKCGCLELYNHWIRIVLKIQQLGLLQEEFLILKALILANSDVKLDRPEVLCHFRESTLNWLSDSGTSIRSGQRLGSTQFMFLVLPSLRQVDEITRKFWRNLHKKGYKFANDLFIEMLGKINQ